MPRLAGDESGYMWALIDRSTGMPAFSDDIVFTKEQLDALGYVFSQPDALKHTLELRSVTTILGNAVPKPFMAGAWWGYRVGMQGVAALALEGDRLDTVISDPEALEELLKATGIDPNHSTEVASARGSEAHRVLELLVDGKRDEAEAAINVETKVYGTKYGAAVLSWWDDKVAPDLDVLTVVSEQPVWSMRHGYMGTLDLAIQGPDDGWEIIDLKTHKPASGFTLAGGGAGYTTDLLQIRAYRMAWEEMGLGTTVRQRVLIARENGKWLEDSRDVPIEAWLQVLAFDEVLRSLERG